MTSQLTLFQVARMHERRPASDFIFDGDNGELMVTDYRPNGEQLECMAFTGLLDRLSGECRPLVPGLFERALAAHRPPLHFIGFRGDEYGRAVRIFGNPDFVHRLWDKRAQQEILLGDIAVFARYSPDDEPTPFAFNDSQVGLPG